MLRILMFTAAAAAASAQGSISGEREGSCAAAKKCCDGQNTDCAVTHDENFIRLTFNFRFELKRTRTMKFVFLVRNPAIVIMVVSIWVIAVPISNSTVEVSSFCHSFNHLFTPPTNTH